ncbi:hypothetical protein QQZ08_007044 [Neonectria magnoliae]|uniref:Uncharacterized protein n=1 Tax=Neonectria magnoliae TaxID=2732573 RepID=A0ABR1HZM8_9HYPO
MDPEDIRFRCADEIFVIRRKLRSDRPATFTQSLLSANTADLDCLCQTAAREVSLYLYGRIVIPVASRAIRRIASRVENTAAAIATKSALFGLLNLHEAEMFQYLVLEPTRGRDVPALGLWQRAELDSINDVVSLASSSECADEVPPQCQR